MKKKRFLTSHLPPQNSGASFDSSRMSGSAMEIDDVSANTDCWSIPLTTAKLWMCRNVDLMCLESTSCRPSRLACAHTPQIPCLMLWMRSRHPALYASGTWRDERSFGDKKEWPYYMQKCICKFHKPVFQYFVQNLPKPSSWMTHPPHVFSAYPRFGCLTHACPMSVTYK